MLTSDIVNYARFLLTEPNSTGRFSDSALITCVNVANSQVMLDLQWPEATLTLTTTTAQEYALPPLLQIERAYMNGQPLIPTTLSRLEGVSLNMYDQSTNVNSPQWTIAPASTYPVQNTGSGYPTSAGNTPYSANQRPVYYLRGGYIGVVPAPVAGQTFTLNITPIPATSTALGDTSLFPIHFLRALGAHVTMQCYEADEPLEVSTSAEAWGQRYQKEVGKLQTWKDKMLLNLDKSPQFVTYRSYYASPVPNTSGWGW